MPQSLTKPQLLDRELPCIWARLIDLAAALDRIDRGQGSAAGDPRIEQIRRSLHALLQEAPGRAEESRKSSRSRGRRATRNGIEDCNNKDIP